MREKKLSIPPSAHFKDHFEIEQCCGSLLCKKLTRHITHKSPLAFFPFAISCFEILVTLGSENSPIACRFHSNISTHLTYKERRRMQSQDKKKKEEKKGKDKLMLSEQVLLS